MRRRPGSLRRVLGGLALCAGAAAGGCGGETAASAPGSDAAGPGSSGERTLVLVTVAGLRSDYAGWLGGHRTTPRIDGWIEGGGWSGALRAPVVSAQGSLAAALTGLPPWQTGVWSGDDELPREIPTVAETLQALGWSTVRWYGFPTTELPGAGRGFAMSRPFEVWSDLGSEVDRLEARTFLWVQLPRIGSPYRLRPHARAVAREAGFDLELGTRQIGVAELDRDREKRNPRAVRRRRVAETLYATEVAAFDRQLDQVLRALSEGRDPATLEVLFVAVQGADLGEERASALGALAPPMLSVPAFLRSDSASAPATGPLGHDLAGVASLLLGRADPAHAARLAPALRRSPWLWAPAVARSAQTDDVVLSVSDGSSRILSWSGTPEQLDAESWRRGLQWAAAGGVEVASGRRAAEAAMDRLRDEILASGAAGPTWTPVAWP